jgi:hypothetical protein
MAPAFAWYEVLIRGDRTGAISATRVSSKSAELLYEPSELALAR